MNKTKRYALLGLSLTMAGSVVLSACSANTEEPPAPSASPEPGATTDAGAARRDVGGLTLPIAADKLELSLWAPSGGNFKGKDFNDKFSFRKMEENTNIHIAFQHAAEAASAEAFTLMMSSGQLPDMVYTSNWDKEASKYGTQGALLPLEELLKEHAPNFSRILEDNPAIRGQITSPDGHIYYMPNIVLDNTNLTQMFPQIRQDWLDKLGLEAPKTTDDWYNVLKSFRDGDPNGNGKQDEIPFVTVHLNNVMFQFAPAFGVQYDFFVEDGKVDYGPYDPRFKDVVAFLNKLYQEKLLDPNYLVDNTFDTLTEKVTSDVAGAWFGWSGSYMGNFTTLMAGKHPTFKIAPMLPPIGPNGDQSHVSFRYPAAGIGIAVSARTEHPEEVVKWLDYQYSEEGIILNNFGVDGVSYDLADGKPVYKREVTHPEDGTTNTEKLLSHTIGGGSWATVVDPSYPQQIREANGQMENPLELYGDFIDFDKKMPPVQFLPEENDVIVPIMADVATYVDESINAFVMGRKAIEEYDAFLAELKRMGIEDVLAQYQIAYERFTSAN
ncbi:extracellular solute-binding protein [Paenibacillus sp.]|uniref:extracellular solute-binding protein n=1 Tax=Paenibacillus sp. TaxID=58172 RepID=UPI002812769E|nr:extracellular solute-binding protein [Paenibacillus sp.]